jgi:hypothetical protein
MVEDPNPEPGVLVMRGATLWVLGELLRSLPEQEQLVIALYYYYRLTLAEVGRVVGIQESRASQIHTSVMMELRSRLLVSMTTEPSVEVKACSRCGRSFGCRGTTGCWCAKAGVEVVPQMGRGCMCAPCLAETADEQDEGRTPVPALR